LQHRVLAPGVGEIVTLEAFAQWQGIGTALVNAYLERAKSGGLREVRVITTNDNVDALRFYQSRGFVIHEVRVNAIVAARRLKPEIPPTGLYGLPIRDEIELLRVL
jgi:ribosomal protein S18 acetylase RimI-like enzyme